MTRISLAIVASALVLSSCSPDTPLINSFQDSYRIVVAGPTGLQTYAMPAGTLIDAEKWSPATKDLYPVHAIKEFRSSLYLVCRAPMIVLLDRETLAATDTIDLSAYGSPSDIAFANATTAYVAVAGLNQIVVVDLTVPAPVQVIDVGGIPVSITAIGNQICVALQNTAEAVIIDSRTNAVEKRITLPTAAPTFVEGDGSNSMFCVVCLGAGKLPDDERDPTTPTLTFIDARTRNAVATIDLTNRSNEGPSQIPKGIIVNASEYAFVPVQTALLSMSTRSRNRAVAAQFDPYGGIAYNAARAGP
jgi:DNA-binding beta-propeller fold protein YncE